MAILAGEPGDPVIILAATVVTVLGTLVLPRLEFTGVKAFFRLRPRPGFGAAAGACDGTSVLVAVVVDFVESLTGLEAGTTSGLSSDLAVGATGATILFTLFNTFSF
jgi:hypothetical protein